MIRTAVLGGLTAAFAAGGFLLGYSHTGQDAPLEIREPDFRKVPRHHIFMVLQTHAERLHLKPNQIDHVRRLALAFFAKDHDQAQAHWKKQVMTAEKIASGEWLPTMDGGAAGLIFSEQTGAMFVYSTPWEMRLLDSGVRKSLTKVVGAEAIRNAYLAAGQIRNEDDTKAYEIAVSPATLERLSLTPLQQKQFATLQNRVDASLKNTSITKSALLPQTQLPFKLPKKTIKPIGLGLAFSLLDPRQRLVLRGMLWDRLCVEP